MKNFFFTLLALTVFAVLAGDARALTRPEVITRAREFITISWSIADTAAALHDSPRHRYWETGECYRHSPLKEWIQNYQGGSWHGWYSGAAYAFGGRQTPSKAMSWVSGGVPSAIGLCYDQWNWRYQRSRNPFCFAGNDDCVGLAGYATWWPDWDSQGTSDILADAQSSNGYYVQLCRGACAGTEHGYEEPRQADLLVDPGSHVVVWVTGDWTTTSTIIEATGNAAYERAVEHTLSQGYEDWVSSGYWGVAVRALKDKPDAGLLWLGADGASGAVAWETGWEKESQGFRLYRCVAPGACEPVGDLIPARGAGMGPTRYEARVPPLSSSETLRLQEIGTDGVQEWLGRTSWGDGIPLITRTGGAAGPLPANGGSPSAGSCTLDSDPTKMNLSWLAICDAAWVDDLQPLIDYRNAHGLRAGVWTYQDLAACGGKTKENIRSRLLSALQTWAPKPRYVLLVGDADYRGSGHAEDLIPMWPQANVELGGLWEDKIWGDRPYADLDGDGDIDLFVGRLPASFDQEVAAGVQHILTWENVADPTHGNKSLMLVEDSGNSGNDPAFIRALADSVNMSIPGSWTKTYLLQSQIGGTYPDFEAACTTAWNSGQGLVFDFGNASGWWDMNSFMNTCLGWSASTLAGTSFLPFLFSGSCGVGGFDREWETCYSSPVIEHLLLKLPDRGAAGALAPTRVVHPYTAAQLGVYLLRRTFSGEVSMGEAAYHAMDDLLAESPGAADHVWQYVYLGDPAMRSLGPAATGVPEEAETKFAILRVGKSRDGHGVDVEFVLPREEPITITVFDVAGRRVASAQMHGFSGPQRWRWDERNTGGARAASGMYFLQLTSALGKATGRVALVR